ncbi:MAG: hypothetical protein JRN11_04850 [Nitrososphaerota archaeon]|nr:hypothetical protein [Nitrososphaerota archaeon]MDG7026056.1 hypothetical protein [Nitrososphaerota archaeon]
MIASNRRGGRTSPTKRPPLARLLKKLVIPPSSVMGIAASASPKMTRSVVNGVLIFLETREADSAISKNTASATSVWAIAASADPDFLNCLAGIWAGTGNV